MSAQDWEEELRQTRLAQVAAEGRELDLKSLVETLERQRDYADGLLLNLTAASQEYLMPSGHSDYVKARRYVCRVTTLDKYGGGLWLSNTRFAVTSAAT